MIELKKLWVDKNLVQPLLDWFSLVIISKTRWSDNSDPVEKFKSKQKRFILHFFFILYCLTDINCRISLKMILKSFVVSCFLSFAFSDVSPDALTLFELSESNRLLSNLTSNVGQNFDNFSQQFGRYLTDPMNFINYHQINFPIN